MLEEAIVLVLAFQQQEVKAKVLEFATIKFPVKYIGIPPFAATTNVDRCTKNDALFPSERFTSISTFA